jgi:alkylation response protein AidB-like acyl-CoA dehydrogenase
LEAETGYHPNAEQRALAGTIEESLAPFLPLSRLHASHVEDARTWASLEEIGVFGISTTEEQGGSGLGAVEEVLIVMALGQRLIAPAVLATIGAAHASLGNIAADLRGRRAAAAYRRGNRIIIAADAAADLVLLRDRTDAALYESGAWVSRPVDDRLWLAGLREVAGSSEPAGLGEQIARFDASQVLRLRLIDAAALAGIAQAALDMSVAYAETRAQFGRPIGSFQAVKHHCANMVIGAHCARDQATFAAVAIDAGRDDAALQVECALFVAGSAALENAGKNIQIHGGIGFSDEADPHLLLKRAQLLVAIAGGMEAANDRISDIKAGW